MTLAEIKFLKRMAEYTRQGYKTNEDILSQLKINTVVKKIKSYGNELIQHVRRMYRDTHLITNYRSQGRPLKRLLDR